MINLEKGTKILFVDDENNKLKGIINSIPSENESDTIEIKLENINQTFLIPTSAFNLGILQLEDPELRSEMEDEIIRNNLHLIKNSQIKTNLKEPKNTKQITFNITNFEDSYYLYSKITDKFNSNKLRNIKTGDIIFQQKGNVIVGFATAKSSCFILKSDDPRNPIGVLCYCVEVDYCKLSSPNIISKFSEDEDLISNTKVKEIELSKMLY